MPLYELHGRRPTLHPTAWVAPSADLIADVVLGEHASVWFGAVIRGDNTTITVGARSNVQEGAMLHSDAGVPLTVTRASVSIIRMTTAEISLRLTADSGLILRLLSPVISPQRYIR